MTTDPSKMTAEEKRALLANLLKRKAEEDGERVSAVAWTTGAMVRVPRSIRKAAPTTLRLRRESVQLLDVAAFERAWQAVIERHASLRATFPAAAGEPRQVIVPSLALPFAHVDAAGDTEAELLARVVDVPPPAVRPRLRSSVSHRLVQPPRRRPHRPLQRSPYRGRRVVAAADLRRFRECLCRRGDWLVGITTGAGGVVPRLRELADRAVDRRGTAAEVLLDVGACGRTSSLQSVAADQAVRAADRWPHSRLRAAEPVHRGITDLAKATGVTPFVVLLSAFAALLSRSSGAADIIIGTPALGRSRADFQGVVGYFVNPLALRSNLATIPRSGRCSNGRGTSSSRRSLTRITRSRFSSKPCGRSGIRAIPRSFRSCSIWCVCRPRRRQARAALRWPRS